MMVDFKVYLNLSYTCAIEPRALRAFDLGSSSCNNLNGSAVDSCCAKVGHWTETLDPNDGLCSSFVFHERYKISIDGPIIRIGFKQLPDSIQPRKPEAGYKLFLHTQAMHFSDSSAINLESEWSYSVLVNQETFYDYAPYASCSDINTGSQTTKDTFPAYPPVRPLSGPPSAASPYSQQSCRDSCLTKEVFDNCGCYPFAYPLTPAQSGLHCNYTDSVGSDARDCAGRILDPSSAASMRCAREEVCPRVCKDETFVPIISPADGVHEFMYNSIYQGQIDCITHFRYALRAFESQGSEQQRVLNSFPCALTNNCQESRLYQCPLHDANCTTSPPACGLDPDVPVLSTGSQYAVLAKACSEMTMLALAGYTRYFIHAVSQTAPYSMPLSDENLAMFAIKERELLELADRQIQDRLVHLLSARGIKTTSNSILTSNETTLGDFYLANCGSEIQTGAHPIRPAEVRFVLLCFVWRFLLLPNHALWNCTFTFTRNHSTAMPFIFISFSFCTLTAFFLFALLSSYGSTT